MVAACLANVAVPSLSTSLWTACRRPQLLLDSSEGFIPSEPRALCCSLRRQRSAAELQDQLIRVGSFWMFRRLTAVHGLSSAARCCACHDMLSELALVIFFLGSVRCTAVMVKLAVRFGSWALGCIALVVQCSAQTLGYGISYDRNSFGWHCLQFTGFHTCPQDSLA